MIVDNKLPIFDYLKKNTMGGSKDSSKRIQTERIKKLAEELRNEDDISKQRGIIIHKLNRLEYDLGELLAFHFDTEQHGDFTNKLMHNTIVSFGNKIKLLLWLKLISKEESEELRTLMTIRNALAHANLSVDWNRTGDIDVSNVITKVHFNLPVISNTGNIMEESAWEKIAEFHIVFEECEMFMNKKLNPHKFPPGQNPYGE